ncbi:MAG: hypothetical protein KAS66_10935 [Candidatus Omnitrophica bacterium]|nr:hypothetical protein [Candidatus Omnitrophota bacterium]
MDKQQKLKIALPILVLVMIVVWGPVIIGSGSKKKNAGKTNNVSTSTSPQGSSADLIVLARSNERKKARTSYTDWGRNPFALAESPKASVLEGIMWDSRNPKAIINGYILGIGEKVGSGVIINIKQTSVTVTNGNTEKVYHLGQ